MTSDREKGSVERTSDERHSPPNTSFPSPGIDPTSSTVRLPRVDHPPAAMTATALNSVPDTQIPLPAPDDLAKSPASPLEPQLSDALSAVGPGVRSPTVLPSPKTPNSRVVSSDASDEALIGYYYGLPSRPRLIATTRFDYRPHPGVGHQDSKRLLPICSTDPLGRVWEKGISATILNILDETCPVGTLVVDVVRIGYAMSAYDTKQEPSLTTIVWIGVSADTITKTIGTAIVDRCKAVLDEHALEHVQVEMRAIAPMIRTFGAGVY